MSHSPCPVTILGGYLGAGKTTVLNHLLRHAEGRRLAVVVNDFGAVNIDADLIETVGADAIGIAGGCVCCGFGDDLLDTLRGLCNAPQPFDHIVIETSGVALPRSLAAMLSLAPGIALAGIVVLADAESVRGRAADRYVGDTVRAQLEAADLLLLTKGDLLEPAALDAVERWLHGFISAPVLRCVDGEVPVEVLLGAFERAPQAAAVLGVAPRLRASAHAAARYDSEAFEVTQPVDAQRLADALVALSPPLVRAKGLVPTADASLRVVQLVGRRCSVTAAPARAAAPGRLVVIAAGEPLDREAVRAAIRAATVPGTG
jgi:G3E family GTPase